jgi:hypothetical protein
MSRPPRRILLSDFVARPKPCAVCGKPGTLVRIFVARDRRNLGWSCEACNGAAGDAGYQLLVTPTAGVVA